MLFERLNLPPEGGRKVTLSSMLRTDFELETIFLDISVHSPGNNFSVEQRDSTCPRRGGTYQLSSQ